MDILELISTFATEPSRPLYPETVRILNGQTTRFWFPMLVPEWANSSFPMFTYQVISELHVQTLQGIGTSSTVRLQIQAFTKTLAQHQAIKSKIVQQFKNLKGIQGGDIIIQSCVSGGILNGKELDTGFYVSTHDYFVSYHI